MGNLAGVAAILAVLARPALVVPLIQTPDIRNLDWHALHAAGVRFLIFDKDNCLTPPHSDHLDPALIEAWNNCSRVFGRQNILIVSNSSGSTDDPSGLGAESLSRSLGVPVLCHSQKKPGNICVQEAIEYFVSLTIDPHATLEQGTKMPPGSSTDGADASWLQRRRARKLLRNSIPQSADGRGSILLVGDRTMTDVVLAHRMNDELTRRRRRAGIDTEAERLDYDARINGASPSTSADPQMMLQAATPMSPSLAAGQGSAASATPPPQCISVLTTGLWADEGRINNWMRALEARVTLYLIEKGFAPGQRGFWFPAKDQRGLADWQSIAVVERPSAASMSAEGDVDLVAAASGSSGDRAAPEPTLGALLLATILRPLPPRVASIVQAILTSRPISWVTFHMKEGWMLIIKGLRFGAQEAGLLDARRERRRRLTAITAEGESEMNDPLTPPPRRKRTTTLHSVLSPSASAGSSPILSQVRWPKTTESTNGVSSFRTFSSLSRRSANETFSASRFLQQQGAISRRATRPYGNATPTRLLCTSLPLRSGRPPRGPAPSPPPPPPSSSGGKVPLRNWAAALAALVLIPTGYYGGAYLHELQELRKAEKEKKAYYEDKRRLAFSSPLAAVEGMGAGEMVGGQGGEESRIKAQEAVLSYEDKRERAVKTERRERRKALELNLYHLRHERADIIDKLARVQERLAESRGGSGGDGGGGINGGQTA